MLAVQQILSNPTFPWTLESCVPLLARFDPWVPTGHLTLIHLKRISCSPPPLLWCFPCWQAATHYALVPYSFIATSRVIRGALCRGCAWLPCVSLPPLLPVHLSSYLVFFFTALSTTWICRFAPLLVYCPHPPPAVSSTVMHGGRCCPPS